MFTYFPSKEDLLNELYVDLKTDVYRRIHAGFPNEAGVRERARHVWVEYVGWAMEKPAERKVAVLLNLSATVSAATRDRMSGERGAVERTMDELGKCGSFKDAETRVKNVEVARADEAAKYREVTLSTVFSDAPVIPGLMNH